jgi:hypothetical protein
MFKKGDLVKFISANRNTYGVPFYVIWYLVTKDSRDSWAEGVVVQINGALGYDTGLITSVGEIETFNDNDVTKENDLSLMVISKYDL